MADDSDDLYADKHHKSHGLDESTSREGNVSLDHERYEGTLTSDLVAEDGARQIGRAITTATTTTTTTTTMTTCTNPLPSPLASSNIAHGRTSTYVRSKRDHVRWSWQSIYDDDDDDEPRKPRISVVKMVSDNVTAAAGLPRGEALGFSCSRGGTRIAAYNSARLFVLQTAALPVNISQEYSLRRRPLAVDILDDGKVLAILADEHSVNIYHLSHQHVGRTRTIRLDHPAHTVALSPTAGLLAAAYEGGVEVFSLAEDALTTDRRAIRSPRMDRLAFSDDASALIGTTTRVNVSSTMHVAVPVFPSASCAVPTHEELKHAWCTGLLNPENIRNSNHAAFMRDDGVMDNDTLFAWNDLEDTFGILRTSDLAYTNVDFPVAISPPLSTCGGLGAATRCIPSVDELGRTVAMVVNDRTVRLYVVPRRICADEDTRVEAYSVDHELDEEYGRPFTDIRWLHTNRAVPASSTDDTWSITGRLVVISPGGLGEPDGQEGVQHDVEGGRIVVLDFDPQYLGQPGKTFTFNLGKAPPLALDEEYMDVATEVALVRKRTVIANRNGTLSQKAPSLGRAASTSKRRCHYALSPGVDSSCLGYYSSPSPSLHAPSNGLTVRRNQSSGLSLLTLSSDASHSLPDLLETDEAVEAEDLFEEPYIIGAPRSVASLHRAATISNLHRFQAIEEAHQASNPNGLPLPAYTEEPNQPLPSRYRTLAGLDFPQTSHLAARCPHGHPLATVPPPIPEHFLDDHESRRAALDPPITQSAGTMSRLYIPRSMQRAYSNTDHRTNTGGSAPHAGGSEWADVYPVLDRDLPTSSTLASVSSWDTVHTGGCTLSPVDTVDTRRAVCTRTSQSPAASNPVRHFSRHLRSAIAGTRSSFRHSLLLPNDTDKPASPDPHASAQARHRPLRIPSHAASFRSATLADCPLNNASLFPRNPAVDDVVGPAHRPSITRSSSAISDRTARGGTAAGNVPHPVTRWFPPAPPAPGRTGISRRAPQRDNNNTLSAPQPIGYTGIIASGSTAVDVIAAAAAAPLPVRSNSSLGERITSHSGANRFSHLQSRDKRGGGGGAERASSVDGDGRAFARQISPRARLDSRLPNANVRTRLGRRHTWALDGKHKKTPCMSPIDCPVVESEGTPGPEAVVGRAGSGASSGVAPTEARADGTERNGDAAVDQKGSMRCLVM